MIQVAMVLLSMTALGQAQKPTLVPAPLDLQPNPALKKFEEPLRAAFIDTLREKAGVLVPTRKEVEQAFLDGKRQDCRESNECLTALAVRVDFFPRDVAHRDLRVLLVVPGAARL